MRCGQMGPSPGYIPPPTLTCKSYLPIFNGSLQPFGRLWYSTHTHGRHIHTKNVFSQKKIFGATWPHLFLWAWTCNTYTHQDCGSNMGLVRLTTPLLLSVVGYIHVCMFVCIHFPTKAPYQLKPILQGTHILHGNGLWEKIKGLGGGGVCVCVCVGYLTTLHSVGMWC